MNEYSREELLDKLVYTYSYLNTIENLKSQIADIHHKYQTLINKEKESNRSSGLVSIVIKVLAAVLFIAVIALTFINNDASLFIKLLEFIAYAVVAAIILFVIRIALSSILSLVGYNKRISNRNIARLEQEWADNVQLSKLETAVHNIEIDAQYLELKEFIPSRFCNATDVAGLWELIEDYRADTFKEAANILRDEQHKYRLEERQEQILRAVHKINGQLNDIIGIMVNAVSALEVFEENTASTASSNALLAGIALMR